MGGWGQGGLYNAFGSPGKMVFRYNVEGGVDERQAAGWNGGLVQR